MFYGLSFGWAKEMFGTISKKKQFTPPQKKQQIQTRRTKQLRTWRKGACVTTCVRPDSQMLMIYSLLLRFHRSETCDRLFYAARRRERRNPCSLSSADSFPHIPHTDRQPRQAEGQPVQQTVFGASVQELLIIFPPRRSLFFACLPRRRVCVGVSLSGLRS